MLDKMRDRLEDWLAKNFCPLIETTGTLVCDIHIDRINNKKRTIAVGFSRYHQVSEPWEYVIPKRGYVLICPSFWLSIPKELVVPYIEDYIDGYMDDYIYGNIDEEGSSGGSSGGCPVTPPCHPPKPPRPPRPPKPPLPPCINTDGQTQQQMNDFNMSQLENINGSGCPVDCDNGDCEVKGNVNTGSKFINTTVNTNNVTGYFTRESDT